MPGEHKVNRAAFFTLDPQSPLLRLYVRLVALELALKDKDATNWHLRHDVVRMAKKVQDPSVNNLADQLDRTLVALTCTDLDGTSIGVPGHNYPYVRYLRHESDFAGETSDSALAAALAALETLLAELKRHGVEP